MERQAFRLRNRVLRFWQDRRREAWRRIFGARELHHLSDRMLRDIGLRRSDLNPMG